MKIYWIPYKPITAGGLINQILTATGSPASAMLNEFSNFNGHAVAVRYNESNKYWIAEYNWAGRQVICRGSFQDCLAAAAQFWKRDGEGASVHAYPALKDDEELCEKMGLVEWSEEKERAHLSKHFPQDFSKFVTGKGAK